MIHPLPTNINLRVYDKSCYYITREALDRCHSISDYRQVNRETNKHLRRIVIEGSLRISNNVQY
jgi:hypothetical protein